jgi:hypothetical protein
MEDLPVVLIANLVLPGSKTASGKYVFVPEVRQSFGQGVFALHTRRRISMVETSDIRADDLVFGI